MNKDKFLLKFKDTFWFLPALYGAGAVILTTLFSYLEMLVSPTIVESMPAFFTVPSNTARSLYAALITAILTMTAISFSNIMVILSMYASQYSPRTLQDFIHSKINQHILGFFTFGFLVSLLSLWFLNIQGEEVFLNSTLAVIIAVVDLFAFIFFIHHSARWLQVNYLLNILYNEASEIISRVFKDHDYGEYGEWDEGELEVLKQKESYVIHAQKAGYIQSFEIPSLISWAKERDIVLASEFQLGEYVAAGMPLFRCWNMGSKKPDKKIEDWLLLIANERTDLQDIEFAIQKVVEIALKAISPAINDPQTAINCINRLGDLLGELGQSYRSIRYYTDKEENLRLILGQREFIDYLYKGFYQIRHYGQEDVSVMAHILESLYSIGCLCKGRYDEEIWEFTLYIMDAIESDHLSKLDYQYIEKAVKKISALYHKEVPM